MAGLNEEARIPVYINDEQARSALKNLQAEAEKWKKTMYEAMAGGDIKGMKEAEKELKKTNLQMSDLKKTSFDVNKVLSNLSSASIKDMYKAIASLKKEQKDLNTNSKEFLDIQKKLDNVRGRLREVTGKITEQAGAWDKMKNGIGGAIGKLSLFAGSAMAAFHTLKGVITSTEGISDEFNALLSGGKEMFWQFQNQIATLDFSNFFSNLHEAWLRGKKLEEQLDKLADVRAYNDYIISSKNRESRALQETIKNVELDISIRNDAAEKRKKIEQEIYDRTVLLAERAFKIEKDRWEGRNKMTADEAVKLYETIDQLGEDTQNKLESVFKAAVTNQLGDVEAAIKSVNFGQIGADTLKGLSPEVIKSYGDYFRLLQKGEAEVLPKLFNAFKNIDEAAADAQMRLNTAIRESSNLGLKETRANEKAGSGTAPIEKLTGIVASAILDTGYNADEFIAAESQKLLENEKQINDDRVKDAQETEQEKIDAVIKSGEEGKKIAEDNWANILATDNENIQKQLELYADFGTRIGEMVARAMEDGTITARDAAKIIIEIALEELANHATIAIAAATIGSLTQPDSIFTFGAMGIARAAILTGLIKAAVATTKGILTKNKWDGGYAGDGDKYEPKGVFHGGEYITPKWQVQSPIFRPMIDALEYGRVTGGRSRANGGPADSDTLPPAAGSPSFSFGTDPELKALIRKNIQVNQQLLRDGVKNVYTWSDADSLRKGMSRLDDIESDVSL
jgi:hypothetical protein